MNAILLFAALVSTPPVPTVSGPVTMPGVMYPNPPVSIVPTAVPYTTRIIVRRPKDAKSFSGTVVGEAMHAGGRSLIFEWSRVSILTRRHVFAEIVHSPAQIQQLKTFNAERYASLGIAMGQSNEIIAQFGRLGNGYRRPDSDAPGNRFRLYEVAGMPHNNSRDNPGFLNDPCTLPITNFPAGAFTALGLNYLIEWIAKGTPPPHAPPIAVDNDTAGDGSLLALDEYGNVRGGVRNVFVDVPIAANGVMGKGKTPAQDRLCQLGGTKVMLPDATLTKLYRSNAAYQDRVNKRLDALVKDGWFLPEYADDVRKDARAVKIPKPD